MDNFVRKIRCPLIEGSACTDVVGVVDVVVAAVDVLDAVVVADDTSLVSPLVPSGSPSAGTCSRRPGSPLIL